MRTLARVLTPIGFIVGITVGVMALVLSQELEKVHKVADAAAQQRSAHELAQQGPGKNAHLVVTDFRFGTSVVEKERDGWKRVVVPIVPTQAVNKPAHEIVLQAEVHDQAELDELLRQETLDVLAASSLKKSVLRKAVKSAAPKTTKGEVKEISTAVQPKLIVLVLPRLGALEGDALFERSYATLCWGVAGVSFALVFACIGWAWSLKGPPSRLDPPMQHQRDALEQVPPFFVHHFMWWAYFMHTWQFYVAFIVALFGVLSVAIGFDILVDRGQAERMVPHAVMTLLMLLGAWGLVAWAFRKRWGSPAEIVAYQHGLRMRNGSHWEGIIWSDVKSVQRGMVAVYRNGALVNQIGETTMTLKDGRVFFFTLNRYTEYSVLANHLQTFAGEAVAQDKGAEFATTGVVEFGPIAVDPDGVIVKGGFFFSDEHLAWRAIAGFEVENGHLLVHRKDYWFFRTISLPLAGIPDYLPLLALLKLRGEKAAADPLRLSLPKSR